MPNHHVGRARARGHDDSSQRKKVTTVAWCNSQGLKDLLAEEAVLQGVQGKVGLQEASADAIVGKIKEMMVNGNLQDAMAKSFTAEQLSAYAVKNGKSGKGSASVLSLRVVAIWQEKASPTKKPRASTKAAPRAAADEPADDTQPAKAQAPKAPKTTAAKATAVAKGGVRGKKTPPKQEAKEETAANAVKGDATNATFKQDEDAADETEAAAKAEAERKEAEERARQEAEAAEAAARAEAERKEAEERVRQETEAAEAAARAEAERKEAEQNEAEGEPVQEMSSAEAPDGLQEAVRGDALQVFESPASFKEPGLEPAESDDAQVPSAPEAFTE